MDVGPQMEKALVGALLLAPKNFLDVANIIKPTDFQCEQARGTYSIAVSLWKGRKHVDAVTVSAEDVSLSVYIAEAISEGSPLGVLQYAKKIAHKSKKERVINGMRQAASSSHVDEMLNEILSLYQAEMEVSSKNPEIKEVLKRFNEHVAKNRKLGRMGINTGFDFLEKKYIQYVAGQIWLMGAYTSVGKTAMMVQKLCNIIKTHPAPSVVVISTEMTEQQVIGRMIANFTGIHSARILAGNLRNGEEEQVNKYIGLIKSKSLRIYDDIYTLGEIETAFRQAELQGGVDVGFIDYVQNCQVPEAKSEYQEGSLLAKRLQKLAKDVNTCLVCLSQVSNDVGRGNTDNFELKGAGEWAAVTDVGVMLQRDKNDKTALKYSVKKNRHGALHSHLFEYVCDYTRLEPVHEYTE